MSNLPNFFIVGAPKAGTTSLYFYLKQHPEIFMSELKEPNFFDDDSNSTLKIESLSQYQKLFDNVTTQIAIGEASTSYLASYSAAKNIKKMISKAKIIIILRNPIDQFFSGYQMNLFMGLEDFTIDEKINHFKATILENSSFDNWYSNQVSRYIDNFGIENVKILIFEEFISDSIIAVKDILKFLNIQNINFNFDLSPKNTFENIKIPRNEISRHLLRNGISAKIAKKINLFSLERRIHLGEKLLKKTNDHTKLLVSSKNEEILQECFQDDVKKLQSLLNRKLPWKQFFPEN